MEGQGRQGWKMGRRSRGEGAEGRMEIKMGGSPGKEGKGMKACQAWRLK